MRFSWRLILGACLVLSACARSDEQQPPHPAPTVLAAPTVLPSVLPTVAASISPGPHATPASADADAEDEDEDDEMAKPWGPEFEIDAEASNYYGPVPVIITFTAKALNGSPPFTFAWDFGDGSPAGTGERTEHTYTTPAKIMAHVIGTDASGATSRVDFLMTFVTPEEFVRYKDLDPSLLKKQPSPAAVVPSPVAYALPPATTS
jgi:hypothetical protein